MTPSQFKLRARRLSLKSCQCAGLSAARNDLLALAKRENAGPFKRASVDEYVLAAACGLNEPIAALTISLCQCS
jgi:hypothetical protein